MSAQRYWYLANDPRRSVTVRSTEERARKDWIRDLPEDVRRRVIESRVLTEPDWPEIHSYVPEGKTYREGRVPLLFSLRGKGPTAHYAISKKRVSLLSTSKPSRGLGKKRETNLLIACLHLR
jgi:hypothetical protein